MTSKPSLKSISKDLGLSTGTISRVLNGKAKEFRISDATVKLVTEYAEEVGYTPNMIAKGLQASKTHTIGLLIPNIADPYFAAMAKNIENAASKADYSIILVDAEESIEREKKQLRNMLSRSVDGIIVAPVVSDFKHFREITDKNIPMVFVDNYGRDIDVPYIVSDNFSGGFDATQALLKKGHKRLGILKGIEEGVPLQERLRGYHAALKAFGIERDHMLEQGRYYSIDEGYKSTLKLMKLKDPPTAIFATSCELGLGALSALKELGVKAPEQVSLVFFDNQPYLSYINPPITTVSQDYHAIGKKAVESILTLITKNNEHIDNQVIPTKFIERESIKALD
jgi:LacI family transcriptional regulator